jgi:hypothetical protein
MFDDPFYTPPTSQIPIRQRLAKWQEEHGNPLSDLLPAIEGIGAGRLDRPDDLRDRDEQSDIMDEDTEIPQSGDLENGDGLTSSKGVYYQMGDLVEIMYGSLQFFSQLVCVLMQLAEKQITTGARIWGSLSGTFLKSRLRLN